MRTTDLFPVKMKIITELGQIKKLSSQLPPDRKVGFVPTMGYLHEGHLSLVRKSKSECEVTVVSIFVNPSQFGQNEDFGSYPRDLERDFAMLEAEGVDYVFTPSDALMYPPGYKTWVEVEELSSLLCGASRPGHFRGVATVVLKLVNLVNPHLMYMGEKDYQQVVILETMLQGLNCRTRIVRCPIIREADGLAMSSRNKYLSPRQRQQALCLYKSLLLAKKLHGHGIDSAEEISAKMGELIITSGGRIDYVAFVDYETLQPVSNITSRTRILLAVFIGNTRLIDNISLQS